MFAIALTLLIIDVKLPSPDSITSTPELWRALAALEPSVFAFVLSFVVILITWVNHHATLKLVHKSSAPFTYANGFLLMTVVFIPFPTGLLGEFLLTDHAAPAVVLYDAVLAATAVGWILLSSAAIRGHLTNNERATATIQVSRRNGYFAVVLYSALSITAFWFPVTVATITTLSWLFWLALGVSMKQG